MSGILQVVAVCLIGQVEIPSWVNNARINSIYEINRGELVKAVVELRQGTGTYTLSNGQVGTLKDLQYSAALPHPNTNNPLPTRALVGTWSLNGRTGYFVFREPDVNGIIDGYWGYQYPEFVGSWDGMIFQADAGVAAQVPARLVEAPPIIPVDVASSNPVAARRPTLKFDLGRSFTIFKELPKGESFFAQQKNPGAKTIVPTRWLEEGIKYRPSVGQIVTQDGTGVGTCFMAGPGIALSAKHIFDTYGINTGYEVRFPIQGGPRFDHYKLSSTPILLHPDIAVLQLAKEPGIDWRPTLPLPTIKGENGLFRSIQEIPIPTFAALDVQVIHYPTIWGSK
ncbi:MAG: hypothetical protein C0483_10360 [Pirellula sp.]|nr:hypothetical protein [Pirellula sp.]